MWHSFNKINLSLWSLWPNKLLDLILRMCLDDLIYKIIFLALPRFESYRFSSIHLLFGLKNYKAIIGKIIMYTKHEIWNFYSNKKYQLLWFQETFFFSSSKCSSTKYHEYFCVWTHIKSDNFVVLIDIQMQSKCSGTKTGFRSI